jgi:DNA polymerase-3 subunit delta
MFYNNPFAVKQAIGAINNYGYAGAEKILLLLYEYNLKNIGINNGATTDADLLKELAVKIIAE